MTEVRIIAVVGMKGAGKTTAVRYLASKGMPKVEGSGDILLEIRNLMASGQREVALDGVESWQEFLELKREFPGQVTTVAVVTSRAKRWKRLVRDAEKDLSKQEIIECDRIEIEDFGVGAMIAAADEYVTNEDGVGDLQRGIEEALGKAK